MSEEKTCKNCKFFVPFADESDTVCWFRCISGTRILAFKTTTACSDHEFAAPPSWEPLDPDDYEPGCTNDTCERHFTSIRSSTNCSIIDDCSDQKWQHRVACERLPCYRPKKKGKTRKVVVVKIPYDGGELDISATSYWDKPSQQMQQRRIFIIGGRTEQIYNGGLSYEIIEEPVK